jgi:hypothetical protein
MLPTDLWVAFQIGLFLSDSLTEITYTFISSMRAACPVHLTRLDFIVLIIWRKLIMKLVIMCFSAASCYFVPLRSF